MPFDFDKDGEKMKQPHEDLQAAFDLDEELKDVEEYVEEYDDAV